MAELTEYQKGYKAAKSTYLKKITDLNRQHMEEMASIDIVRTYPYNLLQLILEEGDCDRYFSPKLVRKVINVQLTEREAKVLEMRYSYGYTLEQCGKLLNVTRERIRQIEAKAIRKLRSHNLLNEMSIVPYNKYQEQEKKLKKAEDEIAWLKEQLGIIKANQGDEPAQPSDYNLPIDKFDLSVRSYNCLYRAQLYTVGDVVKAIKDGTLKDIRNLGKRSAKEVTAMFAKYL